MREVVEKNELGDLCCFTRTSLTNKDEDLGFLEEVEEFLSFAQLAVKREQHDVVCSPLLVNWQVASGF